MALTDVLLGRQKKSASEWGKMPRDLGLRAFIVALEREPLQTGQCFHTHGRFLTKTPKSNLSPAWGKVVSQMMSNDVVLWVIIIFSH